MSIFPASISTDADLYLAVNNVATSVAGGILTAGATTITVADTTNFPSVGILTIELEAIHYTGKTATTFTGVTRGFDGTTAASHPDGVTVFHDIPAAHHNSLKDEIIAIETYLKDVLDKTANGTAALPAYTFGSDDDTGMYNVGPDVLGVSTGGGSRMTWENSVCQVTTPLRGPDGTSSVPTFSFVGDTDTGVYLNAPNSLAVATSGAQVLTIDGAGTMTLDGIFRVNSGSASSPTITFTGDEDTGIYSNAPNSLAIATNGMQTLTIDEAGTMTLDGIFRVNSGSATSPTLTFTNDSDTGFANSSDGSIDVISNGVRQAAFLNGSGLAMLGGADINANRIQPNADNVSTLGTGALRWSDVRSVLINGADYGFSNGYILREYPASFDDVQTKSPDWMKKNANKGIQLINDKNEMIMVFGRDGTLYAKDVKPLSELPA